MSKKRLPQPADPCEPIYGQGDIGQVVILHRIEFEDGSHPLAKYPQPQGFTIIGRVAGPGGYYLLQDDKGEQIAIGDPLRGPWVHILYDLNTWLSWDTWHSREQISSREAEITRLYQQVDLLKGILIAQGYRIVSPEQAKALGLK